jgi:glycosyltransferase involved in cell wall biosynthesis
MTTRLSLVTLAVSQPMGQQVYEHELSRRASAELGPQWQVDQMVMRTLRSPLPGTVRLPSRLLIGASPELRRAAGALLYRGRDLVHRMDLRLPPAPRPEVLTVHDVVPLRFPDEGSLPRDARASARRAARVICASQFAADEVASQLGVESPVAIHNGVDGKFFHPDPLSDAELEAMGIRSPFVLHAGGCTQRKNLAGLADAWPRVRSVRPDTTLVLIGPADERRDRLFGPLAGTVRLGRVGDQTVPGLMAAAAAVVVPSLYEGFGLPALEGLAAGVPVVAADRTSLPEVCGDAAYLVEPDGPGLADGLLAALEGGPATEAMVARGTVRAGGFTWDACAAAHAEQWRSVME